MKSPGPCFVYLIAAEGAGRHLIKVGISQNVPARISNLQTASPYQLDLVHQFEFPDSEIAAYVEQCFHDLETEHRLKGEWFAIDPDFALYKLCIYIEGIFELHFRETKPEYVELSCRLSGLNSAKEKLAARIDAR